MLGAIAAAACAPLAPDLPEAEFTNQLTTLGVRAVMVLRGHETAARRAASSCGVPVIELAAGDTAGSIACSGLSPGDGASSGAGDTDPALLLFTSGTTGSPKLVPLTERNLLTSAANVADTLRLEPTDRCLNVMPLFLSTDSSPRFRLARRRRQRRLHRGFPRADVPEWIEEFRPTWYTAVPTIHQAMLQVARSSAAEGRVLPRTFRFVRSSSAALPVGVLDDLEAAFDVPVIEAYGMTEAAHQMTSNPLPDEVRKPGTVGKAAGPDVAVLDDRGQVLPRARRARSPSRVHR